MVRSASPKSLLDTVTRIGLAILILVLCVGFQPSIASVFERGRMVHAFGEKWNLDDFMYSVLTGVAVFLVALPAGRFRVIFAAILAACASWMAIHDLHPGCFVPRGIFEVEVAASWLAVMSLIAIDIAFRPDSKVLTALANARHRSSKG